MSYPSEFPSDARAVVEAAKIKAGREFEKGKKSAQWTTDIQHLLGRYILRIFLAFATEAKNRRFWPVDKMKDHCREFLRRTTIEAYYEKGYDKQGSRLSQMISNYSGAILGDVQREFEEMPEWAEYEAALLEVAESQISQSKQRSDSKPGSKVGENIDKLRLDCGWSLNDLADQTGLERKLVRGHINGKGIRPATLKKYADTFSRMLKKTSPSPIFNPKSDRKSPTLPRNPPRIPPELTPFHSFR